MAVVLVEGGSGVAGASGRSLYPEESERLVLFRPAAIVSEVWMETWRGADDFLALCCKSRWEPKLARIRHTPATLISGRC